MAIFTEVTFDNAKLSDMLGHFSKLPVELRLSIWDLVFLEIHPYPRRRISLQTNILSILRCSRHLYCEISHHLYNNISPVLLVRRAHHEKCWITAGMSSNKLHARWDLESKSDTQRHIASLPYNKLRDSYLFIEIRPSSRHDPGQIIHMWQKLNYIVDILQELPHPPRVRISLLGRWAVQKRTRESIKYIKGYRPDHDIVMLPFTRLSRWEYSLPSDLSNVISHESSNREHSLLYRFMECERLTSDGFARVDMTRIMDIDHLRIDTRIYLDSWLGCVEGKTADILRLERFKYWYEPGDSWQSAYEEQYLADLVANFSTVRKHVGQLLWAKSRFEMLILMHHIAWAEQDSITNGFDSLDGKQLALYTMWDPEVLSKRWRNGVGMPVETLSASIWRERKPIVDAYTQKNTKRGDFWDELEWWGWDASFFLEEPISEGKWCCQCLLLECACIWCKKYDSKKACRLCREEFPLRLLVLLPRGGCFYPNGMI